VLFDDTYASCMEPRVGLAAVELLEGCGYEVVLGSGRMLSTTAAVERPGASGQAATAPAPCSGWTCSPARAADRVPGTVLRFGPGRRSARLLDDEAMGRRVASSIRMIDVFLDEQVAAGKIAPLSVLPGGYLLHGHCHQKAEFGTAAIHRHFARIGSVEWTEVDSGCCGMAGSFGYEHYDLSRQIGEDRLFPAVRAAVAEGKRSSPAASVAATNCATS
jgi:hypothetical protein